MPATTLVHPLSTRENSRPGPRRPKAKELVAGINDTLGQGAAQIFLLVWTVLILFPLGWSALGSLKTDEEIFASPWSFPQNLQWENYARAWSQAEIGSYFLNTVVVVGGSLTLTMAFGSMAAYILARFEFRFNRPVFYLFIAGMMFPVFLALVPLFFIVESLGLLGTKLGLVLVLSAYQLPFTVFFLVGFFRTLPTSVAEASTLDGCGHLGTFWRIMLPMAKPGIVSVGIFNFLGLWNNYLLPLVLNPDPNEYVLSQGLAALAVTQGYASDFSALFAGMMIALLPVLAVYLVFHRKIQGGVSIGALK